MRINAAQLTALCARLESDADAEMVAWLRRRYPAYCSTAPEAVLRALVERERRAARAWGIEREDDLATFLDCVAMYGPDFARQAWAVPVLASSLHGPDKMAILRNRIERSLKELADVRHRPGSV